MAHKPVALPDGWNDDLLSQFQTLAFKNELATFVHAPEWQEILGDVATVIDKCSSCIMQLVLQVEEPSANLLFLNSHSHYLASVRAVTAGHCLAAYPLGRATVESALYGWYLATHAEAALRWHKKPIEREELKKWGREFKFSSLTKELGDERLVEWAKYLHQTAIDFGAHPNKEALYSNLEIINKDVRTTVRMTFLHQWNTLSISTAKFVVETGMLVIRLFSLGFPNLERDLALPRDLGELATKLSHLQKTTRQNETGG